jgi:hypothetical protein
VQQLREEGTKKGESLPDLCGYHRSDDNDDAPGKSKSHWVVITRNKANLKRVLEPKRWEQSGELQSLMGATLWPAQAGTALGASTGLAYAFGRIAEVAQKDKAVKAQWKPLPTIPDLQSQLKGEEDENRRKEISDMIRMLRGGAWTDDYSNVLSVFDWR